MDRFLAGRPPSVTEQLVDALGRVDILDDADGRRACVSYAQEILGRHVRVRDSGNPHLHLFHIVRAFGDVPDGWRALTHAVWIVSGKDHHAEYAASLVDPIEAAHSTPVTDELLVLLDGLDKSSVPRLDAIHRHAAGDAFAVLPGVVGTAAEAYEHLARINLPADGIARSLRFLTDLAAVVPSDRGDALRTWISRQVRASAPEPQAAQAVLDDLLRGVSGWRQEAKSPAYLLIRLSPSSSGNRIDVTYWTNYGAGWEPRRRDDRSLDADQVRAYVATVLDREEAHLHTHRGNLVVEFILPLSMIHEPVHLWSRHGVLAGRKIMDTEFGGPPLHYDYTVYVRSLERIDTLHWHRAWRMRWEAPDAHGGARMHRCRRGEGARHDGLYARLAGDPAIAVLGLSAPPDDPYGAQELSAALVAGVPLVAWPFRSDATDSDPSMIENDPDELGGYLRELTWQMARLRSASRTGDDTRGGCARPGFAVLWDDPTRLPEVPERIA
ncbi:MAG: hypothetical protein HOV66_01455 [Streptomycetaceae bacterium]|nr:hypothetical protein [Streptomycetaceae bacterium]